MGQSLAVLLLWQRLTWNSWQRWTALLFQLFQGLIQSSSASYKQLLTNTCLRKVRSYTLGLLRTYHKSNDATTANDAIAGSDSKGRRDSVKSDSPRKRLKANQDIVG